MSKRSRACDISQEVKRKVWERDHHHCIYCGSPYAMPNAHYIARSHGGLGIEENVVTLCMKCHHNYDNGKDLRLKQTIKHKIEAHLASKYANWYNLSLKYKKGL